MSAKFPTTMRAQSTSAYWNLRQATSFCTRLEDARCRTPSGTWSESGRVCFFQEPPVVFTHCPRSDTAQVFVQAAIVSEGHGFLIPDFSESMLSLSPCGGTVLGLEPANYHPNCLHSILHFQLPSPSTRPARSRCRVARRQLGQAPFEDDAFPEDGLASPAQRMHLRNSRQPGGACIASMHELTDASHPGLRPSFTLPS